MEDLIENMGKIRGFGNHWKLCIYGISSPEKCAAQAHVVHSSFYGAVWSRNGVTESSNSGQEREEEDAGQTALLILLMGKQELDMQYWRTNLLIN